MNTLSFDQRNADRYVIALGLMAIACVIVLSVKLVTLTGGGDVDAFSVVAYAAALCHATIAAYRIRSGNRRITEWFMTAVMTCAIAVASNGERLDIAGLMAGSAVAVLCLRKALGPSSDLQTPERVIRIRMPWTR